MKSETNKPYTLFNGTYTFQNTETKEHRTFCIKTQKQDAEFAPGSRIVSLMTGTDNEKSYTGFAFIKKDRIYIWRSRRGNKHYRFYARLLEKAIPVLDSAPTRSEINGNIELCERKYSVKVAKKCAVCNRKLTSPESIARGVGPECAKKI